MRGSCLDIARGWIAAWTTRGSRFAAIGLAVSASFGAFSPDAMVPAQEQPAIPAVLVRRERNLLMRTNCVRLEVIGGRIAVLGHRCGQSRTVQVGEPSEVPFEQLVIQLQAESLIVHYEDVRDDQHVMLDLDDQQRLTLTRTSASPTRDIKLVQPFRGPITVTCGRDPQQKYSAATLWHLALQQPELCEEYLFPLLETLRPHWRLQELSADIQQELLSHAGDDVCAERAQWRTWVVQLDSDDFEERQEADQRLRGAGQGVMAWLQRLDRRQLSAEQTARVHDICQGLADLSTDSPQRVTSWLLDDRCAWLALLRSSEPEVRIAAANHLTVLFGKPIPFSPLANLSDREQQISQLQVRFGR